MGDMKLDLQAGFWMGIVLVGSILFLAIIAGIRTIARSRKLMYYQLRKNRIDQGWRLIFFSLVAVGVLAAFLPTFIQKNDLSLALFPSLTPAPSATPYQDPTNIPDALPATATIEATPDPIDLIRLPRSVAETFTGQLTPGPETVFSGITISKDLNLEDYSPIDPGVEFEYPVKKLVATFSYDKMIENVQWTVVWYRDDEMVFFETIPWEYAAGGYGYAEVTNEAAGLLPGMYLVEMYLGYELYSSAEFMITGTAPQPTNTKAPTSTPTASQTKAPTPTPTASHTRIPTSTPTATHTRIPTTTPTASQTRMPTITSKP